MAKDKKKKKSGKKAAGKNNSAAPATQVAARPAAASRSGRAGGAKASATGSVRGSASKAAKSLKALRQNPLIADVVAAALVATASALRDTKKARKLASEAGDELDQMSRQAAERGSAMWDMALDIGRRSLEALSGDEAPKPKSRATPKTSKKNPAKRQSTRKNNR
jgi:hypothetical protein